MGNSHNNIKRHNLTYGNIKCNNEYGVSNRRLNKTGFFTKRDKIKQDKIKEDLNQQIILKKQREQREQRIFDQIEILKKIRRLEKKRLEQKKINLLKLLSIEEIEALLLHKQHVNKKAIELPPPYEQE